MKYQSTIAFISQFTAATIIPRGSNVIPGQDYEKNLTAGKKLGVPLQMNTYLGTKEATHRTASVDTVVTSCMYEMGDFLRVDHTDVHIVGAPDSSKEFMWNNGLGCGTCFKVTYKPTGLSGMAVVGDYCAGCVAEGHDFDISDALQEKIAPGTSTSFSPATKRNLQSADLIWEPVACNWGGRPMRYVLAKGSNQFNWFLNIQGNSVPIMSVSASWTSAKGSFSVASKGWGASGGGSWPIDFMADYRNNPGFGAVTITMKGFGGEVVVDTITFPPESFNRNEYTIPTLMTKYPVVMGTKNFAAV